MELTSNDKFLLLMLSKEEDNKLVLDEDMLNEDIPDKNMTYLN